MAPREDEPRSFQKTRPHLARGGGDGWDHTCVHSRGRPWPWPSLPPSALPPGARPTFIPGERLLDGPWPARGSGGAGPRSPGLRHQAQACCRGARAKAAAAIQGPCPASGTHCMAASHRDGRRAPKEARRSQPPYCSRVMGCEPRVSRTRARSGLTGRGGHNAVSPHALRESAVPTTRPGAPRRRPQRPGLQAQGLPTLSPPPPGGPPRKPGASLGSEGQRGQEGPSVGLGDPVTGRAWPLPRAAEGGPHTRPVDGAPGSCRTCPHKQGVWRLPRAPAIMPVTRCPPQGVCALPEREQQGGRPLPALSEETWRA